MNRRELFKNAFGVATVATVGQTKAESAVGSKLKVVSTQIFGACNVCGKPPSFGAIPVGPRCPQHAPTHEDWQEYNAGNRVSHESL